MKVEENERAEVVSALREALARTGLTQAEFATLLGTSPARLSTYLTGTTVPNAALYLRALRVAAAHAAARAAGRMTPESTARAVNDALADGDRTAMALRLVLQARDDLRDGTAAVRAGHRADWLAAWQDRARPIRDHRYDTLLRAVVAHELGEDAPGWARGARLSRDWVLPDPFRDPGTVREQTPDWLAAARIFIAERGLSTV